MKNRIFTWGLFFFSCVVLTAQTQTKKKVDNGIFKGLFYSQANHVQLVLDLYQESVIVPGYEFLGKMNGYLKGDASQYLYGTWMLINFKLRGDEAELRFSNDIGSDSQTVIFTHNTDGTFSYSTKGSNNVSKAVGRKLVKVADKMNFMRKNLKLN